MAIGCGLCPCFIGPKHAPPPPGTVLMPGELVIVAPGTCIRFPTPVAKQPHDICGEHPEFKRWVLEGRKLEDEQLKKGKAK